MKQAFRELKQREKTFGRDLGGRRQYNNRLLRDRLLGGFKRPMTPRRKRPTEKKKTKLMQVWYRLNDQMNEYATMLFEDEGAFKNWYYLENVQEGRQEHIRKLWQTLKAMEPAFRDDTGTKETVGYIHQHRAILEEGFGILKRARLDLVKLRKDYDVLHIYLSESGFLEEVEQRGDLERWEPPVAKVFGVLKDKTFGTFDEKKAAFSKMASACTIGMNSLRRGYGGQLWGKV